MNDTTALAGQIATLWATILQRDVAPDDDILQLGASSLQVLQFRSELQRSVGKRLGLRDIYTAPLPEAMARALGELAHAPQPDVRPAVARDDLASPAQAYFFEEAARQPCEPYLYMTLAFSLEGEIDAARLQASFQRVAQSHEALRTGFTRGDAGVIRHVAEQVTIGIAPLTLGGRHDSLAVFLASELQAGISLSDAPVYRLYLSPASAEARLLVLLVPHIAMDGFSLALWLREVMAVYAGPDVREDTAARTQESDFIAWQSAQLTAGARDALRRRFSDMMAGLPPGKSLAGEGREAPRTMNGRLHVAMAPAFSLAVDRWAAQHRTSLYSVLTAAWNLVFFQYRGATDTVIRASGSIRDQAEFSRTLGMFWAPLFVRCRFNPDQTLDALVRIASDAVALAQSLQYLPPLDSDDLLRTVTNGAWPVSRFYFTLHNDRIKDAFTDAGLRAQVQPVMLPDHGADGADMKVHLHVGAKGIGGSIMYSETLFDQAFVGRFFDDFVAALKSITTAGDLGIAQYVASRRSGRR